MGVTPGMIESGFPSVNGVGIVLEILLKFIVFGRFWLEFQWKATPGELIGHGQPFKLTVSGGGGDGKLRGEVRSPRPCPHGGHAGSRPGGAEPRLPLQGVQAGPAAVVCKEVVVPVDPESLHFS